MLDLLSLSLPELEAWLAAQGEPRFRARQLYEWLYRRLETDFSAMSTLPGSLRDTLANEATAGELSLRREQVSKDGRTRKLLLALGDGRSIESVLMLFPATSEGRARATACISTQVGGALGCTFCATGQMGFERHLTAGEIVGQVLYLARELRERPWTAPDGQVIDHLTNLVLM